MKVQIKNHILIIVILTFLALFSNCGYDDGPCFEWDDTFNPELLGNIKLNDSNDYWINKDLPQKLFYRHSEGIGMYFVTEGKIIDYTDLDFRYRSYKEPCGTISGYDIYKIEFEKITFTSDELPLSFEICRKKKINNGIDSASLINSKELLFVKINDYSFEIAVDSNRATPFTRYYDSIFINDKWFYQTYHTFSDTNTSSTGLGKIVGVYYNTEYGLLEFYSNKGDKWYLEK